MVIERALKALKKGEIVLIFDGEGREEETDIAVASQFVKARHVRTMRKDGGGLICTALHWNAAERLGLPHITEVFHTSRGTFPVLEALKPNDIPYDEKSSFSLTVNHRKTFTGVTDRDRALTISELAGLVRERSGIEEFGRNFRAPGHVVLLKAARGLLEARQGHTELSVALTELGGLAPIATICEMMGEDGYALAYEDAKSYARMRDLPFVEGRDIRSYYLKERAVEKTL